MLIEVVVDPSGHFKMDQEDMLHRWDRLGKVDNVGMVEMGNKLDKVCLVTIYSAQICPDWPDLALICSTLQKKIKNVVVLFFFKFSPDLWISI